MPAESRKNTWRWSGKYLLLTYAQTPEDFDENNIMYLARSKKASYHISREKHQDGGTHYHALFCFPTRFQTRNTKQFDVSGHHPNWTSIRYSPGKAYDYVEKDGDIVASNMERPKSDTLSKENANSVVYETIASSKTKDEFMEAMLQHAPRDLITAFGNVMKYVESAYSSEKVEQELIHPKFTLSDNVPEALKSWVSGFCAGQAAAADKDGDTNLLTVKERLALHATICLNI